MDLVPALFYERVCRLLSRWASDHFKDLNDYFESLCTRMEKTWLNAHCIICFDAQNGSVITFGLSPDRGRTYVTKSLDDVPKNAHLLRYLEIQVTDRKSYCPWLFHTAERRGQWPRLKQSDLSKLGRMSTLFPTCVLDDYCLTPDESSEFYDSGFFCQGAFYIAGPLNETKSAFLRKQLEMDLLNLLAVSEHRLLNGEWTDTVFKHFFKSRILNGLKIMGPSDVFNEECIARLARMWASRASVGGVKKKIFVYQQVFYEKFDNDLSVRTIELDENTVEVTVHLPENPSRVVRWKQLRDYKRLIWPETFLDLYFVEI
ncbi:hypothetical protein QR680_011626 [Steinernema hermaphroditum]|uniref:Uncharacterized protein n=1 Tax=Steinernema hermaphroditum TaxID=289476 RepID=A0AA39LZ04_9BILA|nr:hypothetical protein QR680_011626 [Steinernema hermaphroditum]